MAAVLGTRASEHSNEDRWNSHQQSSKFLRAVLPLVVMVPNSKPAGPEEPGKRPTDLPFLLGGAVFSTLLLGWCCPSVLSSSPLVGCAAFSLSGGDASLSSSWVVLRSPASLWSVLLFLPPLCGAAFLFLLCGAVYFFFLELCVSHPTLFREVSISPCLFWLVLIRKRRFAHGVGFRDLQSAKLFTNSVCLALCRRPQAARLHMEFGSGDLEVTNKKTRPHSW